MRKYIVVLGVSIIILTLVVICINFKPLTNSFWNFIAQQFENEEKIRENSKYGSVGKDTLVTLGDGKFQLIKFANDKALIMYKEDKTFESLLHKVSNYKRIGDKLYVVSDKSYGVVDGKTNMCRLYKVASSLETTANNEYIKHLSSYEEFSKEEKAIFEAMMN